MNTLTITFVAALCILTLPCLCASHSTPTSASSTSTSTPLSSTFNCAYPPENCAFYQPCVEDIKPCGPNGYALGFGQKYCQSFTDNAPNFSSKGQQWIPYVRRCLQNQLYTLHNNLTSMTCQQIASFAFQSHYPCYLQGPISFCDLPWSDRFYLVWIVKGSVLSGFSFDIGSQGVHLLLNCSTRFTQSLRVTLDVPVEQLAININKNINAAHKSHKVHKNSDHIATLVEQSVNYLAAKLSIPVDEMSKSVLVSGLSVEENRPVLGLMVSLKEERVLGVANGASSSSTLTALSVAQQLQQALTDGSIQATASPVKSVRIDSAPSSTPSAPSSSSSSSTSVSTCLLYGFIVVAAVFIVAAVVILVKRRQAAKVFIDNKELEIPFQSFQPFQSVYTVE